MSAAGDGHVPGVGPITGATVVVTDLDAAIARYTHGLGWRETASRRPLGAATATRLGWPVLEACPTAEVGSGVPGRARIRLVGVPEAQPIPPVRTFGWSGIELSVPDVTEAVCRAERAGFRVLRAPAALAASPSAAGGPGTSPAPLPLPLVAAQLAGPDGDVVYLTQVLREVPGFELPEPTETAEIFICVFAARDLPTVREVLETRCDVRRVSDREVAIAVVNTSFGLPAGTLHWISSVQLAGRHAIELDQYPADAVERSAAGPWPPAGILAVSVRGLRRHPGDGASYRPDVVPLAHGGVLDVE